MNTVLLILLTEVRHDARVLPCELADGCPGPGEEYGVIESYGVVNGICARFFESFGQAQLGAMFMACRVESTSFIDTDGAYNELVPFPMPDGMAHPFGVLVDLFRMLYTVEVNDPKDALVLK